MITTPPQSAPRWQGAVLYPATLLLIFLGAQGLLGVMGVASDQRATIAAIPALAALLITLPMRLRRVWHADRPWQQLGVQRPLIQPLLRGIVKAAVLLLFLECGLGLAGAIHWQPTLSMGLVANAIALALGVGFAEELLFRGWLLGELEFLLGRQKALLVQAAIFSLAHTRFNLPILELAGLLGGLFLLGLALALQRRADGGALWGAVGLHGGLVGGWFLLQSAVLPVDASAPAWLMGPDNPIGGVLGWVGLSLFLVLRRRWWRGTQSSQ